MLTPISMFTAVAVALIAFILLVLAVAIPHVRLTTHAGAGPTTDEPPKSDYSKAPDASTIIERASAARKR